MEKKNDEVDWNDSVVKKWIDPIVRKSTRAVYKCGFRAYIQFTKLTPSQIIDEALKDEDLNARDRENVVLNRVVAFYEWLKNDYGIKTRGKGEHKERKKGASDNMVVTYVTAIRSFYSTYGIEVKLKGRNRLPRPKVESRRMKIGASQVKVLLDHTRSLRDRAVILTLFQGGMDVSTLCSLKLTKELKDGLDKEESPLKLDIYRPKTGVDYYTFLGKDAIKAIKAYLTDSEYRGISLSFGDQLFVKERKVDGQIENLTTQSVQKMLKDVAIKSGLVDKKMNGNSFNPLGPHALRESFGSIMINSGVPDTVVDFWLGHQMGSMSDAYKSVQLESLKKMYVDREKLLSISQSPITDRELDEKVNVKVDEKVEGLQKVISNYALENVNLKEKVKELSEFVDEVKNKLDQLSQTEKQIADLKKSLEDEVKFYREDGITVGYTKPMDKEELKEIIEETKSRK